MTKAVPALFALLLLARSWALAQGGCNHTPACAEGSQWNTETKACEEILCS